MSSRLAPTIDYEYSLVSHAVENMVLMGLQPQHHVITDTDEDRYMWVVQGLSICSQTCGGGGSHLICIFMFFFLNIE